MSDTIFAVLFSPLRAWVFVFMLSCMGRGLCEGLIARPEESYRVSNCVIKKPQYRGGQGSTWAVALKLTRYTPRRRLWGGACGEEL
jgi:hypothetical protein